MEHYNEKDILSTLKYGKYINLKTTKRCIITLYICLAVILITFISGLYYVIKEHEFALLCMSIFVTIGIIIGIIYCTYLYKTRKLINLWLIDSVKLTAYSKIVNDAKDKYNLEITFEYNNATITKTGKLKTNWLEQQKDFTFYNKKQINILYSPNYDEVIILKA